MHARAQLVDLDRPRGDGSMRTGSCRHCGHTPVAKNAPACPNCGGLHPTGYQWWPLLVVVGVAVVMLLFVLSIISR